MKKPIIHTFASQSVQHESAQFIAQFLEKSLKKNQPILLLFSGGSAIAMYKEMVDILINKIPSLSKLTFSLFDERFVPKNSTDSNEEQLRQAGVIQLLEKYGATWIPYLESNRTDGLKIASEVSKKFQPLLKDHQLIILAGIGDDGHTAGLLPVKDCSPNQKLFESKNLVEYFEVDPMDSTNPFHFRCTATPTLISVSVQVILFVTGAKKQSALNRFILQQEEPTQCPALVLYKAQNPPTVLTDIILEENAQS